jgi:phosphonate transport system permease protein
MAEPRPHSGWSTRLEHLATIGVIAVLIAWAWQGTEFDLGKLAGSMPRLVEFFTRMVPPDLTVAQTVALSTIETLPGVLTIAVHATGMLGKFYAEAFENADPAPLEALQSTGASWLQTIRFGALTQVAPDLARDTLFRFELNLRESLVLGLVGAGGIGFYIQLYIRAFQYDKVATLTLVVLAMVIATEQLSVWVRRRLR